MGSSKSKESKPAGGAEPAGKPTKAEKKLIKAAKAKAKAGRKSEANALDLSGSALREVPKDVLKTTTLVSLVLKKNELTALPPDTSVALAKLESLDVSHNRLASLGDAIGEMYGLRTLVASGNRIATFPTQLVDHSTLTKLDLSANGMTAFPRPLSNAVKKTKLGASLKTLVLAKNKLLALPDDFAASFISLTSLDLSFNRLSSLPDSFGELSALRRLALGANAFTEVPLVITHITSLYALGLSGNKSLEELPRALADMPTLEQVGLVGCPLSTVPEELRAGEWEDLAAWLRSGGSGLDPEPAAGVGSASSDGEVDPDDVAVVVDDGEYDDGDVDDHDGAIDDHDGAIDDDDGGIENDGDGGAADGDGDDPHESIFAPRRPLGSDERLDDGAPLFGGNAADDDDESALGAYHYALEAEHTRLAEHEHELSRRPRAAATRTPETRPRSTVRPATAGTASGRSIPRAPRALSPHRISDSVFSSSLRRSPSPSRLSSPFGSTAMSARSPSPSRSMFPAAYASASSRAARPTTPTALLFSPMRDGSSASRRAQAATALGSGLRGRESKTKSYNSPFAAASATSRPSQRVKQFSFSSGISGGMPSKFSSSVRRSPSPSARIRSAVSSTPVRLTPAATKSNPLSMARTHTPSTFRPTRSPLPPPYDTRVLSRTASAALASPARSLRAPSSLSTSLAGAGVLPSASSISGRSFSPPPRRSAYARS